MSTTISIPPDVYSLLEERAQQEQTSPNAVAEAALRQYLSAESQNWRTVFDELIAKVHSRAAIFTSDEIEADITAAADEVKESRRARRAG